MKVLITAPTFVPGPDQPELIEENTFFDCDRDQARRLTEAQKALYVERKDDPTKGGFTATEAHIARIEQALASAKASAKK